MSDPADDDPISLSFDHWVEFTDTAINLTGIPDEQFRSVDDDGNPVVETESIDRPLIEFDDLPLSPADGPPDNGVPAAGANGSAAPGIRPSVPPKSV